MKTIDLVVPCYNEEAGLEHFVLETNKVIDSLPEYSFRYILVNDGSKDRTYLIMKKLAKTFNNIKYISFSRNFGKRRQCLQGFNTQQPTMLLLWTPTFSILRSCFLR